MCTSNVPLRLFLKKYSSKSCSVIQKNVKFKYYYLHIYNTVSRKCMFGFYYKKLLCNILMSEINNVKIPDKKLFNH